MQNNQVNTFLIHTPLSNTVNPKNCFSSWTLTSSHGPPQHIPDVNEIRQFQVWTEGLVFCRKKLSFLGMWWIPAAVLIGALPGISEPGALSLISCFQTIKVLLSSPVGQVTGNLQESESSRVSELPADYCQGVSYSQGNICDIWLTNVNW